MIMNKQTIPDKWDLTTDVVVMGSGGAGLAAAISARVSGAKVLLIEKSDKIGGTTAVSGGIIWVPLNHHMEEAGIKDSRDEALKYVQHLSEGKVDDLLIETLVDKGPEMVRFMEAHSPIVFEVCKGYPDYHPEWDGGLPKGGRSLESGLFDSNELVEWKDNLRKSPLFGLTPVKFNEAMEWGIFRDPSGLDMDKVTERLQKGIVGYGEALIGKLLKGCIDLGVDIELNTSGKDLIRNDKGRVIGITCERNGEPIYIKANNGVILASGGFEWNWDLMQQFLPGPKMDVSTAPPFNEGDSLLMAMEAGANLSMMSEAWWFPGVMVPGETYEDKPLMRLCLAERSLPHSIMVNKYGKRFVNEAHNYNDIAKVFNVFDPVKGEYPNIPAWLILDRQFIDKYMLITSMPGEDPPNWVAQGDTLDSLAVSLGIDSAGLKATVIAFNGYAKDGKDPDFQRGDSAYDRFQGDNTKKPNPNLGTLEKPPYYAIPIYNSNLGTKGGPVIDKHGRVLSVRNVPIEGLYAAGNAAMAVTGPGYGGAGGTIGPAMVFGYLAGKHAAKHAIVGSEKHVEYA
jgi:3-oxosteroid 1-dehydrogenase